MHICCRVKAYLASSTYSSGIVLLGMGVESVEVGMGPAIVRA